MPQDKPREFWVSPDRDAKTFVIYEDSNGMKELVDCFCASEEPLDSDAIHVIEYSAFQIAIEGLKCTKCQCRTMRSAPEYEYEVDECVRCQTLKELGVLE